MKRARGTEAQLKRAVLAALDRIPRIAVQRQNSGSRNFKFRGADPGTPDIAVYLPRGRVLWIELKRGEREKLRPSQIEWRERMARIEHHLHLVTDVQQACDLVVRERDAV